ncbi:MAG: hypothetical protein JRN09_09665 [Nitrososphaerota archaeon]|nr:hypothetical protein [Nitrososphaerota archaeon]
MNLQAPRAMVASQDEVGAIAAEIRQLVGGIVYHGWEQLRRKHAIGVRVRQAKSALKHGSKTVFLEKLASQASCSTSFLHSCEQFADLYPTWDEAIGAISPMFVNSEPNWDWIVSNLLTKRRGQPLRSHECFRCREASADAERLPCCKRCYLELVGG